MRTPLPFRAALAVLLLVTALTRPAAPPVAATLDLFGDPLPPGATARLGAARLRHGDEVVALAFSPDGSLLATGGKDRRVRVWESATGRLVLDLAAHTNVVFAVAFAPDGKTLASGGWDNVIRLWDVATGDVVRAIKDPDHAVSSLAYSPDGKLLASGAMNGRVRVWDPVKGARLHDLKAYGGNIRWLAFLPDSKRLFVGGQERQVTVWDATEGKGLIRINDPVVSPLTTSSPFAVSPRGDEAAISIGGGRIGVVNADTTKVTRRFPIEKRTVIAVAWSPTNNAVAVADQQGAITLHDPVSGRTLRACGDAVRGRGVKALAFSPDGKTLASAEGCAVRLWRVLTGGRLPIGGGHSGPVRGVAFSPDGSQIATASMDTTVALWDRATGQHRQSLTGHVLGATCLAYAPDGRVLVVGSRDSLLRLYDPVAGKAVRVIKLGESGTFAVAFTPDGKTFVTSGGGRQLTRWRPDSDTPTGGGPAGGFVHALAFSPDGKSLAISRSPPPGETMPPVVNDASVSVRDQPSGVERLHVAGGGLLGCMPAVGYSGDGKTFASTRNGSLLLWDPRTGTKRFETVADGRGLHAVAVSPANDLVATGGSDGRVRLWDLTSGEERRALIGHAGPVLSLAFSPDGRWLVSGSADGTALVWDARSPAATPLVGLDRAWADLGSPDAVRGYAAVRALAERPGPAVELLAARLKPAELDEAHTKLVAELGGEATRRAALAALEKAGYLAEPALRRGLEAQPDSAALRGLLERLDEPVRDPERLRRVRGVEVLERIATDAAKAALRALARGEVGAELTREAAASLARLEKAP